MLHFSAFLLRHFGCRFWMRPLLAVFVLGIAFDKSEGPFFSTMIDSQAGIMKLSLVDNTPKMLLLIAFSNRKLVVDYIVAFERSWAAGHIPLEFVVLFLECSLQARHNFSFFSFQAKLCDSFLNCYAEVGLFYHVVHRPNSIDCWNIIRTE